MEDLSSTITESDTQDAVDNDSSLARRTGCWLVPLILLIALGGIWFFVRPGVFTIQPIGALPEGITVVYHSRGPQMPFYSSPDGLCLQIQGSVSLLCRMSAMSVVDEFSERIIWRLPYSEFAYLRSTGGLQFDR